MEKKSTITKTEKVGKVKVTNLKVKSATTNTTKKKEINANPLEITLKKQEIKRVIELFTGTKNTPKTSINDISKVLNVPKKQIMRVLHTNNLKTYKESSLK